MIKQVFVIGFMLFAIFFGAGNLIFPIELGWMHGSYFWPAIIGFLVTGVGMPLLGIIASSFSDTGIPGDIEKKVHPLFSVAYMVVIYLSIGPLFAIPRTASTSYEIGVVPFVGQSSLMLFIFSVIYFAIVLFLSIKPSRMVDAIGKYLTPVLLVAIAALCIIAFFKLNIPVTEVQPAMMNKNALSVGFLAGYQTMDTMASVAFAIVVLNAAQATGITKETGLFKYCCMAGIIAGVSLGAVYLSLGWIGNNHPIDAATLTELTANNRHIGAYLLSSTANISFGPVGPILVSIIVLLACLTTAIGLVVAVSGYFHMKFPKIKYEYYAVFFTLISLILSNQGLEQVIKGSLPVLSILYPVTIVIITLVLIDKVFFSLDSIVYQITIAVTSILSFISVLAPQMIRSLPLAEMELHWIYPAIISLVVSVLLSKLMPAKAAA